MRFRLLVSEAWRSLGANISTTFAATMTVLVGMVLLGLFIALGSWTLSWSNHIKNQLVVKVYFETQPEATREQKNAVARALSANPQVASFRHISKEQAYAEMKKRRPEYVRSVPWNPFPDALEIKATKPEHTREIANSLRNPLPPGVKEIDDGRKISDAVLRFAHVIQAFVTIATIILLAAATVLIANTIRLSIFSRRREIEVMKLVGATNWFIRGPFMIEGLICGVGGALAAVVLLLIGKELALSRIGTLSNEPNVHALSFPLTALILLGAGLLLGALASGLTLRRFLKV